MPIPASHMANVSTEDLVYLFESSGIGTGIDTAGITAISRRVRELMGTGTSHVGDFGSLATFLEINRDHLRSLQDNPPGDARLQQPTR